MTTKHVAKTDPQVFLLAWQNLGGYRGVLKSMDFRVAVLVALICWPAWSQSGWWGDPISVLPSLLGFTLGGFAIFLGFGSDQFKDLIANEDELKSEYLSVSAIFLYIVSIQVLGLIFAVISKAIYVPVLSFFDCIEVVFVFLNPVFWFLGFFVYIYGIVLSLRAAVRIFRVSRWYNSFIVAIREERAD
jgi:hypothetical protein